jgi:OHCU decarboxylase
MAASRPFAGAAEMTAKADQVWAELEPGDCLQAFAAHPRIGEPTRSAWEAAEQSGITLGSAAIGGAAATSGPGAGNDDDDRRALERLNRDYEARFGHIFIVCAAGKTAREIVELLERRLGNNPDEELRVAAREQSRITRLRLAMWLT